MEQRSESHGTYDYIIVGAGSAGCVLANRLSADPAKRILLLEAGPRDKSALIHTPIGIALLANSKKLNWAFNTEPQQHLNARPLFWPRGKTLGGSSSINAMVYMRGHKADYDGWEVASGTSVWGWDRVRALFKRLENNQRFGNSEYHGTGGELFVSELQTVNPLSRSFVKAGRELQIQHNDDFNGERQEGVGLYQVTQNRGRRWSSAKAFLESALDRPNLEVITDARVTRVVMDGRRAIGVSYRRNNKYKQARLNPAGEVLLSGGAVNSPQIDALGRRRSGGAEGTRHSGAA